MATRARSHELWVALAFVVVALAVLGTMAAQQRLSEPVLGWIRLDGTGLIQVCVAGLQARFGLLKQRNAAERRRSAVGRRHRVAR